MNCKFRLAFFGVVWGALAGCASTPEFHATYYQPKATLKVQLVQTAGCSAKPADDDDDAGIVASPRVPHLKSDLKVTVNYSSNTATSYSIDLSTLDGALANSDITLDYYEDGRLKGMSTTQKGQGGEVVKSALQVATAALASGEIDTVCNVLDGFKDGIFQLTREASYDVAAISTATGQLIQTGARPIYSKFASPVNLSSPSISTATWTDLRKIFGDTDVSFKDVRTVGLPKVKPNQVPAPYLTLTAPKEVEIRVNVNARIVPNQEFTSTFLAPSRGETYRLPLQKAPWFGTNRTTLALSESGMITKLSYGSDSGVASALTSTSSIIEAFDGQSVSEELAELKAENDLRAEQAREIRCLTTPEECK